MLLHASRYSSMLHDFEFIRNSDSKVLTNWFYKCLRLDIKYNLRSHWHVLNAKLFEQKNRLYVSPISHRISVIRDNRLLYDMMTYLSLEGFAFYLCSSLKCNILVEFWIVKEKVNGDQKLFYRVILTISINYTFAAASS